MVTAWLEGVTLKVGVAPAWVTVTTIGVSPATVTVIFAVRWTIVVFSVYVAETVPLPEPDKVTVHQVWSLPAVHELLDVTANDVAPEDDVTFWFDGETLKVGVAVVVN